MRSSNLCASIFRHGWWCQCFWKPRKAAALWKQRSPVSGRRQDPEAGKRLPASLHASVHSHRKSLQAAPAPCSHQTSRQDLFRASISWDSTFEPATAQMLSPTSPQSMCYNSRRARRRESKITKLFQSLGKQSGNALNFHFDFTFSSWIHVHYYCR